MAHYLVQLTYSSDAWAAQLRTPQNRVDVTRPLFDRLGIRIESVYYAFGEYDLVLVVEAPTNVNAAALSLAVTAGGACKSVQTTPLMTIEEGIAAMRMGAEAATVYTPPA